jgi:hypothetical protein
MEGTEMKSELFSEIAIEAITPRKNLALTTSEKNGIYTQRLDADTTKWTLICGPHRKTFISCTSPTEVASFTIMATDFFDGNGED